MPSSNFAAEDPNANARRASDRDARRADAITADSRQARAGIAAGRDRRSIGVTRTPAKTR